MQVHTGVLLISPYDSFRLCLTWRLGIAGVKTMLATRLEILTLPVMVSPPQVEDKAEQVFVPS